MNITSAVVLFCVSFTCAAQTTETKYYRFKPFDEEVEPSKAKYSVTTTQENGIITTTTRNLKTEKIERSESWKGDEPVGVWVGLTRRGPEEVDYDFELIYNDKSCTNETALEDVRNYFEDNAAARYTAPVIAGEDASILPFIKNNLRYPVKAMKERIEGKVEIAFTLTKDATIKDIVVTKGVHLVVDKEAVRCMRKMKFSSPPLLNGQPQDVCMKQVMSFRLN